MWSCRGLCILEHFPSMTSILNIIFFLWVVIVSVMNCLFVDIMQFFNVLEFIMVIRDANVFPFYTFIIWSSPIITPDTYNGIIVVVLFHYNSCLFGALFLRNNLLENMLQHNQPPYYICLDLRHLTEKICDWEVAQHLFYISDHTLGQQAHLMLDPNSLWKPKISVVGTPASHMSTGKVSPHVECSLCSQKMSNLSYEYMPHLQ